MATPTAIRRLSASRALAIRPRGAPARGAAIAAGMTARLEHEVRAGRRLCREDRILIHDHEAASEQFAHGHAAAGVGAPVGPGAELQPPGAELHGVVLGDDA